MTYKCPRCGYSAVQKGDIKKHFKRKKICLPSNLNMSIEECYKEVLGEEKIEEPTVCKQQKLYTEEQVKEITAAQNEIITGLKKQIEVLLTKVGDTTNNITININANELSKDKMEYIKELITTGPNSAIPKLLEEIHFKPDHSENHSVNYTK